MSVSLQKGQKVSLTKESAGLGNVMVGLGWDEAQPTSKGFFAKKPKPIDCDASVILLKNGKVTEPRVDVVYYGNLQHKSGMVRHMGDNLTGAGDGDDEQILVDLANLPQEYDRLVVVVNIYQAVQRNQHFGMIRNAYIHLTDGKTNRELCRYNLSDDYNGMTAMIFGEIYRHGNEWKFNAIGQGTTDPGLSELVSRYR